jgi:hypothetical protein
MSRSWKCGWLDGVVQLPSGVVQLSRRLGPLGVTDTKHYAAVVEPGAFRTGLFNPGAAYTSAVTRHLTRDHSDSLVQRYFGGP